MGEMVCYEVVVVAGDFVLFAALTILASYLGEHVQPLTVSVLK